MRSIVRLFMFMSITWGLALNYSCTSLQPFAGDVVDTPNEIVGAVATPSGDFRLRFKGMLDRLSNPSSRECHTPRMRTISTILLTVKGVPRIKCDHCEPSWVDDPTYTDFVFPAADETDPGYVAQGFFMLFPGGHVRSQSAGGDRLTVRSVTMGRTSRP